MDPHDSLSLLSLLSHDGKGDGSGSLHEEDYLALPFIPSQLGYGDDESHSSMGPLSSSFDAVPCPPSSPPRREHLDSHVSGTSNDHVVCPSCSHEFSVSTGTKRPPQIPHPFSGNTSGHFAGKTFVSKKKMKKFKGPKTEDVVRESSRRLGEFFIECVPCSLEMRAKVFGSADRVCQFLRNGSQHRLAVAFGGQDIGSSPYPVQLDFCVSAKCKKDISIWWSGDPAPADGKGIELMGFSCGEADGDTTCGVSFIFHGCPQSLTGVKSNTLNMCIRVVDLTTGEPLAEFRMDNLFDRKAKISKSFVNFQLANRKLLYHKGASFHEVGEYDVALSLLLPLSEVGVCTKVAAGDAYFRLGRYLSARQMWEAAWRVICNRRLEQGNCKCVSVERCGGKIACLDSGGDTNHKGTAYSTIPWLLFQLLLELKMLWAGYNHNRGELDGKQTGRFVASLTDAAERAMNVGQSAATLFDGAAAILPLVSRLSHMLYFNFWQVLVVVSFKTGSDGLVSFGLREGYSTLLRVLEQSSSASDTSFRETLGHWDGDPVLPKRMESGRLVELLENPFYTNYMWITKLSRTSVSLPVELNGGSLCDKIADLYGDTPEHRAISNGLLLAALQRGPESVYAIDQAQRGYRGLQKVYQHDTLTDHVELLQASALLNFLNDPRRELSEKDVPLRGIVQSPEVQTLLWQLEQQL